MTREIKRIVVPLDFSATAHRALDYAHSLARRCDAVLHLVHVCEVPAILTPATDANAIAYSDRNQQLVEEAELHLLGCAAQIHDVNVTTEAVFGQVAYGIVDAASANDADLIVMGTRGHGAVMHRLTVAERVARTASCAVLTVREPKQNKERAGDTGRLATAVASILVAGVMFASGWVTSASAQEYKQTTPGAEVFRTYCASCHGTAARGDGPLASLMTRKPANLTEMAKRNGGQFPSELVFKTIDGRQPIRGHGGPDMPVWGDAFSKSREAGDAESVKAVIASLVQYLESVQLRATHEQ